MSISAIMGAAVSGMQAHSQKLSASAQNVANASTPGYDRKVTDMTATAGGVVANVHDAGEETYENTSNVDMADEMISTIESEIGFKANASVWETGADMWDALMSIKKD